MALKAQCYKNTLNFRFDAGTSRGVLKNKDTFFIKISDGDRFGLGEAAPLEGLSPDFDTAYKMLFSSAQLINEGHLTTQNYHPYIASLPQHPSVQFALETAFLNFKSDGLMQIFDNPFYNSRHEIAINGLVWMGEKAFMKNQILEKINAGFETIKLKIGAIKFEDELDLIHFIRSEYSQSDIGIRVDANGAFEPNTALEKLKTLTDFDLHSIEQPIKAGQIDQMADLCLKTPLPIALDEELIYNSTKKSTLLEHIKPQYIILKPSLMGGLKGAEEWIAEAEKINAGWWITSALESNIGLNAICQFSANYPLAVPQGLGTGQLYHNNMDSPLTIQKGHIFYDKQKEWDLTQFQIQTKPGLSFESVRNSGEPS
jgi:o-succinylbenzoate synthase